MKKENKVAKMVKKIAVASARNAVNKKYVIMLYEHEATDAVKKALKKMHCNKRLRRISLRSGNFDL